MQSLDERIYHYSRLIRPKFGNVFPIDFELRPLDWILTEETVQREPIQTRYGPIRALGTMDVEFISNDIVARARSNTVSLVDNYPCGHKCPGCFSEEDVLGDSANLMTWQEVMETLDVAREIGLSSIKFLGPGELFQNPDLFDILDACEERNLPISIFTKGAELGSDELAVQNYGHLGVTSVQDLVDRVTSYDTVRILLGFNSFFESRQNKMIGSTPSATSYALLDGVYTSRGVADYTNIRDRALELLVDAGLNASQDEQKLTLVMAPMLHYQVDEVAAMYEWAARRNMPIVIAPSMESGPNSQKLVASQRNRDPDNAWVEDALLAVYGRALAIGTYTMDQIREEGLSPYFGIQGCNQVANGLMLRANGQVKICPGSSAPDHIYGNVHAAPGLLDPDRLVPIYLESLNYRVGQNETLQQNNWCIAKRELLPFSLRTRVMEKLEAMYG